MSEQYEHLQTIVYWFNLSGCHLTGTGIGTKIWMNGLYGFM